MDSLTCVLPSCSPAPAQFLPRHRNHSSTTIVNGQSFSDWFKDTYIFDYQGTSPLVSGFYFDDYIREAGPSPRSVAARARARRARRPPPSHPFPCAAPSGGFPDPFPNMTEDMGLTPAMQAQLSASYTANMQRVYDEVLSRGMFSWQQLWNGQGSPSEKNGCCTRPLVEKGSCAASLRSLCSASSPAQTRFMKYAFSPGGCSGDPGALISPLQDIANFLLVRGPYALLGHGWLGCSRDYQVPPELNGDYGEPTELCHETGTNTGVFTRDWTKSTITMDCNTWTPTITMK